jgi:hypothetical protein
VLVTDHNLSSFYTLLLLVLSLLQGVPHHAKAGNLNNCILKAGSTGQLIIVLDCDMLPEKCMARTVAPFFYKRTSAVLQQQKQQQQAAANNTSSSAVRASLFKSKKAVAVHPNRRITTSNASSATATSAVTSAGSSQVPFNDIETGDAPTLLTTATTSTAASAAAASAGAGAALSGPVFDYSVGLLQTPQAFYNLDTHDLLGQSYSFFYECVISGWDGAGCTPCCGTGVTFSR